ncbi:multidrug effflux MFS transporter [Labrenzia sp. VG12]|uniref:multidrug effflux MFS transporter n=1 Tax=Labrenzia sp. VG12 TaxID=2021862 RepID=UPI000B8BB5BA|nr:multidrug effflux MFS transporter [Labrenzia sp. VG12]ASP33399.1 Bcr/CflA family drug resistance efflux transporter [Labrenzia sp. VG12]
MQSPTAGPRLSTLILLSALCILPINIFLPSLTNMAAEFDVDYAIVGLSLAAYAAVSALLQLVLGPLSDRFGRRPVILGGLVIFLVATLGCILARDIWWFLTFRLIQAVIAPTYAVALAVVRDTTSKQDAASKIGYIAMAWAVAPMLGPGFGGLLDETFGWRASFWFLAAFGVSVLVLCWFDLKETNRSPSDTILEQFRTYPELIRSRRFWAYTVCMGFSIGAFFAFLAGAPLAANAAFDLSPGVLGLFMGSITGGFMIGSFLSGRFAGRVRLTTMMLTGRIIACAGLLLGLGLYVTGADHVLALFGPCMLVGLSNGLTLPSANAGVLSVRPKLAGSAAGLAGAFTVMSGAIMSWIAGMALSDENVRYGLLVIMLGSAMIALGAAVAARRYEHLSGSEGV